MVHGDKREEQAGRWGWVGLRNAGGQVAGLGNRLVPGDRGLRVRVHREGGALIGSTLLRRTAGGAAAGGATVDDRAAARDADRIAKLEAQVAGLLAMVAMQDGEIAALAAAFEEMGPVTARLGNLHGRLDDVEAVAHRHVEDENFADAEASGDDDDDAEEGDDE